MQPVGVAMGEVVDDLLENTASINAKTSTCTAEPLSKLPHTSSVNLTNLQTSHSAGDDFSNSSALIC